MFKNALRLSVVALLAAAGTARAQFTGPSSSQPAYLLPTVNGVTTTSILTAGDSVGGYTMVGIPDGMGAFQAAGSGTFTLAMNHELGSTSGSPRAHGSIGSFVSQWEINPGTLAVVSGRDQTISAGGVYTWNGSGYVSGTTTWNRFCSGDLAATSAFYNPATGLGTQDRIYLNGEENGDEGRGFAHVLSGADANTSWQLPRLGRQSWENLVASPFAQDRTVVMGNDDSTVQGGVYMYVGNRTNTGSAIERAGLTNGSLYGITVQGTTQEVRSGNFTSARFGTFNYGDVSNSTGASLNGNANNNVMSWLRPEDGAWDPRAGHQNDYYFVTTDRFNQPGQVGTSRLWRMTFDDITNPAAGGTVTMLLDGSISNFQMFDNMCIDQLGRILLEEDVGNNAYLGGVFLYDIDSAGFGRVAQHDPGRFINGAAGFLTQDEEASGIIDAGAILGQGWFLLDSQAHYGISGELVEGGQLMAMYIPTGVVPTPGAAALVLVGAGAAAGRRRR